MFFGGAPTLPLLSSIKRCPSLDVLLVTAHIAASHPRTELLAHEKILAQLYTSSPAHFFRPGMGIRIDVSLGVLLACPAAILLLSHWQVWPFSSSCGHPENRRRCRPPSKAQTCLPRSPVAGLGACTAPVKERRADPPRIVWYLLVLLLGIHLLQLVHIILAVLLPGASVTSMLFPRPMRPSLNPSVALSLPVTMGSISVEHVAASTCAFEIFPLSSPVSLRGSFPLPFSFRAMIAPIIAATASQSPKAKRLAHFP